MEYIVTVQPTKMIRCAVLDEVPGQAIWQVNVSLEDALPLAIKAEIEE